MSKFYITRVEFQMKKVLFILENVELNVIIVGFTIKYV